MNDTDIVYPDYTNSLVNVPHSVLSHFNLPHRKPALNTLLLRQIKACPKLILFLIDGFGYNLYKSEAVKFPFYKNIDKNGLCEKITSVFPSTTAAAITSINTGLTPIEHGLLEWNLYFREIDAIMQPLPYKIVATEFHSKPITIPESTKFLFDDKTIYQILAQNTIPSFYFIPKTLTGSVYTKLVASGAKIIAYVSIVDLLIALRTIIQETSAKAYCYVYWESIDTQEHVYGPRAEQTQGEIALFAEMIQKEFIDKLDKANANDTALLITADHGQTTINSTKAIYLNDYPQVTKNFKKSKTGLPILPIGSPRDVFLHIEEGKVDEVVASLQQVVKDTAEIIKLNRETIAKLFANEKPHPEFFNRLGNILILPRVPQAIWYKYLPTSTVEFKGNHGGLTTDEMYIPFIAAKISQLQTL